MLPLALLPLLNNIHWTLVLRLRFDGKKLPSIFFRLYLHCLLSVIDVLCIIHYAVIVHILSPIHSAHSFAANLSEARKKLCKFRWKLSRIFILVHFSLDAHWKVHIQRKIIPSKTDVFLYCLYSFCFRFKFFSSGFSANHPICTPMRWAWTASAIIILNMCKRNKFPHTNSKIYLNKSIFHNFGAVIFSRKRE